MSIRSTLLRNIASERVYCAHFGEDFGTFFTMEMDGKQYLITAKHLAEKLNFGTVGVAEMTFLPVLYNKKPASLFVSLVGHGKKDVDISVLASTSLFGTAMPSIKPISPNIEYGEDVFFFGFPYPEEADPKVVMDASLPTPFVKKGVISYISNKGHILIDGQNNPGFSGGPVVMRDFEGPNKPTDGYYHVIGVVSGYKGTPIAVLDNKGKQVYTVAENSGIMVVHDISSAVYMIKSNPIGFPLPY